MAETIDARVFQKTDTLANWMANPLILGKGEQAFVESAVDGAPLTYKLGDGTKRFSLLPWPDYTVRGKVSTSFVWTGAPTGVYLPTVSGTYNGVSVDLSLGYTVLYWDNSTLVKVVYGDTNTIASRMATWTAKLYLSGDQVNYNGKDYVANANTISTDVPGVSTRWSIRLYAYEKTVKDNAISAAWVKTENLFNYQNLGDGAGKNITVGTGALVTSSGWNTSDNIPVTPGDTIYFSRSNTAKTVVNPATYGHCYYNISGTYISGLVGSSSTVPAGAAYMRFAANVDMSYLMVTKTAVPSTYISYGYYLTTNDVNYPLIIKTPAIGDAIKGAGTEIKTAIAGQTGVIDLQQTSFFLPSVNIYNNYAPDVQPGYSISSSTGQSSATTGWNATGFISVKPSTTYTVGRASGLYSQPTPSTGSGAYYDAFGTYISGATFSSGNFTTPSNAAFFRFSTTNAITYLIVVEGTTLPTLFIQYAWTPNPNKLLIQDPLVRPYAGKKWLAVGDSITYGAQYFGGVVEATGIYPPTNIGVVGQTLRQFAANINSTNMAGVDIVTVLGGTNDYGHGSAVLGTLADDKTVDSIYGAVKLIIDTVLTINPLVKLVFFTPLNRGAYMSEPVPPAANIHGLTIDNIRKAMLDCCAFMGVPCLDLGGRSGLNSYNFSNYIPDQLHPNSVFGYKMGLLMGRFINNV